MNKIQEILEKRILVLDGAMGTMIQRHKLEEEDFRKGWFESHHKSLKGNNDLLSLTRPEIIEDILVSKARNEIWQQKKQCWGSGMFIPDPGS